jgi:hypothetical protein
MTTRRTGTPSDTRTDAPSRRSGTLPPDTPTLTVVPWRDELVERVGHDVHGEYVERFWLGILGPTATWLLRRLASELAASPSGFELDLATTAGALGIGWEQGRANPLSRALQRLVVFGMAQCHGTTLAVRVRVPPLAGRQLARLPQAVQDLHRDWADAHPMLRVG